MKKIEKSKTTVHTLKAQAAIDFLMTYGWAIVLIVLVAAALFSLGIFDTGTFIGNKAVGFTQVQVVGFKLAQDGTLTMKFQNQVGEPINVTSINATYQSTEITNINTGISNLGVGKSSSTVTVGDFGTLTAGNSYTLPIKIGYKDLTNSFDYTETGTLNGVVEE